MADLIRMGGIVSIPKDRMDTPSSDGSEDEGAAGAIGDLVPEIDQDEFDGPMMVNGKVFLVLNCVQRNMIYYV